MARIRLVNGKPVPFTPEEEAARDAEEQAYLTAPPPPLPPPSDIEVLRVALLTNAVITQANLDAAKTKLTT